ncbi:hypothetical protein BC629DRAFT_951583 [Irpex lacteus]|nr:hypothetical protein BC629DRAFT_951583 [Irpex lacteus]
MPPIHRLLRLFIAVLCTLGDTATRTWKSMTLIILCTDPNSVDLEAVTDMARPNHWKLSAGELKIAHGSSKIKTTCVLSWALRPSPNPGWRISIVEPKCCKN